MNDPHNIFSAWPLPVKIGNTSLNAPLSIKAITSSKSSKLNHSHTWVHIIIYYGPSGKQ